jgi:hypothetical protein
MIYSPWIEAQKIFGNHQAASPRSRVTGLQPSWALLAGLMGRRLLTFSARFLTLVLRCFAILEAPSGNVS